MNCKPGDLAIVANATNPNIVPYLGKVVTCISVYKHSNGIDTWIVDPELAPNSCVYDGALKPIRPNDGEDEMIRIAGKPHDAHKSTPETA